MGIGGAIFEGNSKLFSGPLGVVRIGFDGYDLGKTTADAVLTPDQDIKDIMYQQDGTKPADHVRTGMEYLLDVTFGEIKTGLLTLLMAGMSAGVDLSDDDGVIDRSIFQSMFDNEAKALRIAACDANGLALAETENILNFYHAIPVIPGELINWGVDTQRNLPVQFRLKYHKFTVAELEGLSRSSGGVFGYWGDPADPAVDCTALSWPDREAPVIVSATAISATEMEIIFNEVFNFQTNYEIGHYPARVNGVTKISSGGVIDDPTKKITITYAAIFINDEDIIHVSISEHALQDEQDPVNKFLGIELFPVTPWAGA